jgi:hypothetical protein
LGGNRANRITGVANTGSGGGGGNSSRGQSPRQAGGNGGSGVVIIRYPSGYTISGGAGLAFTTATVGDDKVTRFTSGTGTISFT